MKKLDLDEVKKFIDAQTPETKIYLGCDSERLRINGDWYADYILAIVVHINGNNGCKIFGEVHRERVWDTKPGKPSMRLMTEVYKVSELYLKLAEVLEGRQVEVHLDINPDEHLLRCAPIDTIRNALTAAGLEIQSFTAQQITTWHPDFKTLRRTIRGVGANHLPTDSTPPFNRQSRAQLINAYESLRTEQGLPLSYEVLIIHARKP